MTPTWYDLLGVGSDAPADEIRAAWKSGIADLDPGDRRFRTLNDAAELLLDAERRAAYDLELAPPSTRQFWPGGAQRGRAKIDGSTATEASPPARSATHVEQDPRSTARRNVPAWPLAALAVLVAMMLACAGYLVGQPSDDAIATATSDAQGAAERAVTTVLAYDYRQLEDDQQAAGALMTPDYKKKYDALFAQIAANAPDLKVVVTAEVVASGIVRSGDDRVQVLVFVNRPTLRADKAEPEIFRDQVVLTMVSSGDRWLVDDMDTNQLAS